MTVECTNCGTEFDEQDENGICPGCGEDNSDNDE